MIYETHERITYTYIFPNVFYAEPDAEEVDL